MESEKARGHEGENEAGRQDKRRACVSIDISHDRGGDDEFSRSARKARARLFISQPSWEDAGGDRKETCGGTLSQ